LKNGKTYLFVRDKTFWKFMKLLRKNVRGPFYFRKVGPNPCVDRLLALLD